MNWSAFAAVVSCLGLLATPITAAFFYGKLAAKVDANDRSLNALSTKVDGHDRQLGELDGWRGNFAMGRSR